MGYKKGVVNSKKKKVLFFAYRKWALDLIKEFKKKNPNYSCKIIEKHNFLEKKNLTKLKRFDYIIVIGWSWIVKKDILDYIDIYGVHPSDLPNYGGGSPIQNQIIDGITKSKVTLYKLTSKIDQGAIYGSEKIVLNGDSNDEIFENIKKGSYNLINKFLKDNKKFKIIQKNKIKMKKRRKPKESRISINFLKNKKIDAIYNFIRCLTDPYPNAYLEDKFGNKILFKKIKFIKKKQQFSKIK